MTETQALFGSGFDLVPCFLVRSRAGLSLVLDQLMDCWLFSLLQLVLVQRRLRSLLF